MSWTNSSPRKNREPAGFIIPCQAVLVDTPPSGSSWIHELKYDGYRILARCVAGEVRLWSRNGLNWTERLPLIATGIRELGRDVILDGEAVCFSGQGLPDFHALSTRDGQAQSELVAFDLLALDGVDLRERPLLERRDKLAQLTMDAPNGLGFSEAYSGDGLTLFRHVCEKGLEGIISKQLTSRYRSGRSADWRKMKNQTYTRIGKAA
jgi:bifunctional non-homologous end joining protein LigD